MSTYNAEVSHAFDTWAHDYEKVATEKLIDRGYSYDRLAEEIAEHLVTHDMTADSQVLEIGVGTGLLGRRLKVHLPAGVRFDGLDISSKMLDRAEATGAYDQLFLSPADTFTYDRGYTHIVTAFAFHSVERQLILLRQWQQLPTLLCVALVDLFPSTEEIAAQSLAHSRKYEHGAPSHYVTTADFEALTKAAALTSTTRTQLGHAKDYDHFLYVLKHEGER